MKSTYDKIADAMYITLKKGRVHNIVQLSDRMKVDMDKSGNVLGIEMLQVSRQVDAKELRKLSSIPVAVLNEAV